MPLIAKYGFANTPIRKITAEVGIGKGTFYDYFTNKEDILNEIVRLVFIDWAKLVFSKMEKTDDPLEKLFIFMKDGSTLDAAFEQYMIVYVDLWRWSVKYKGSDEFIPKFRSYLTAGKNSVTEIIKDAQEKGAIKKELDAAATASAVTAGEETSQNGRFKSRPVAAWGIGVRHCG